MVTSKKPSKVKAIRVEYAGLPLTAFGGLALAEGAARRVGLWRDLEQGERGGVDGAAEDWLRGGDLVAV